MRVITGTARGRRLLTPHGERVRPTLDRVREALFSMLMDRLERAAFLDLFAGSGANGIEALSRGALRAVFVDNHPESLDCIRKNLATTGLEHQGQCLRGSLPHDLARLPGPFDIIFADPPYDFADYIGLLTGIDGPGLLKPGGTVVVEHEKKTRLPEAVASLTRTQQRHYGMTTLTFYA